MKVNAVNKAKIIKMLNIYIRLIMIKSLMSSAIFFSLGCVLYEKEQKLKGKGSTE